MNSSQNNRTPLFASIRRTPRMLLRSLALPPPAPAMLHLLGGLLVCCVKYKSSSTLFRNCCICPTHYRSVSAEKPHLSSQHVIVASTRRTLGPFCRSNSSQNNQLHLRDALLVRYYVSLRCQFFLRHGCIRSTHSWSIFAQRPDLLAA